MKNPVPTGPPSPAPAPGTSGSSCDDLDAELHRLLLEDDEQVDEACAGRVSLRPAPPPPPSRAVVMDMNARIVAIEELLDERLDKLQSLAEARIYAAAVDAAHSVRRALAGSDNTGAQTQE